MTVPLLTLPEAAARLGVSIRTMRRLRAERRIGCIRVRGRQFRFTEEDVEEFIRRNHERPAVVGLRRGTR